MFFECECGLIGRSCTQMCGINIVDNWILRMNYPNVVTNRIMSLAYVFNAPLMLRRGEKYKKKFLFTFGFLINNSLNYLDAVRYICVYTSILLCWMYSHNNIFLYTQRYMLIACLLCFRRYMMCSKITHSISGLHKVKKRLTLFFFFFFSTMPEKIPLLL